MNKTINIAGKDVTFVANGATVPLYGLSFGGDFVKDLQEVMDVYKEGGNVSSKVIIIFDQLAYTMAKQADATIPDFLEWLGSFDRFPFDEIFPPLLDLWTRSNFTNVESKNAVSAGR